MRTHKHVFTAALMLPFSCFMGMGAGTAWVGTYKIRYIQGHDDRLLDVKSIIQ